jgi:probable HAF family extracellular repeat protein
MKRRFLLFAILSLGFEIAKVQAQPTLISMGDLPGGTIFSLANGVSSNGSVAVGSSISTLSPGPEAFRWLSPTMVGLGDLAGGAGASYGLGVSGDGLVVVGQSGSALASLGEAFRWTSGGGMVGLNSLGDSTMSQANAASTDGSVVVGFRSPLSGSESFRWTSGGGMASLVDLAGGSTESQARGVSGDGSIVVGYGTAAEGRRGTVWTSGTGMLSLGTIGPSGSSASEAYAISSDGTTIVGWSHNAVGDTEAFRTTVGVPGLIGLGDLGGGAFHSIAKGVSSDGSLIVGTGTTGGGGNAFFWTAGSGMTDLMGYLMGAGTDVSAWTKLTEATGVSADGTTIVGYGTRLSDGSTQAFQVYDSGRFGLGAASSTAPEPATLVLLMLGLLGGLRNSRRLKPAAAVVFRSQSPCRARWE